MRVMRARICGVVDFFFPTFLLLWLTDKIPDMVETEERKLKEREGAAHEQEERDAKAGKGKQAKHQQKAEHHEEPKNDRKHITEPKDERPTVRG